MKTKKRFKIEIIWPFKMDRKMGGPTSEELTKSFMAKFIGIENRLKGKKYSGKNIHLTPYDCEYTIRSFLAVFATPIKQKGRNIYSEEFTNDKYQEKNVKILINRYLDRFGDKIDDTTLIRFEIPNIKALPINKWLLPKYNFDITKGNGNIIPTRCIWGPFVWGLYKAREKTGEKFIAPKLLVKILEALISISQEYDSSQNVSLHSIQNLNLIKDHLPVSDNPIATYLNSIFSNFIKELIKDDQIVSCINCGRYSPYFRTKKFCSNKCLRRFHSKKDYHKHREKRLPVKRSWLLKTRREIPHY